MPEALGDGTRTVRAGLPPAAQGEPVLPGPVFASAFHLAGDDVSVAAGYLRHRSPTGERYESALGGLEGGEVVLFSSGMAAVAAVLGRLGRGDVLVAPADGYPGVGRIAREQLEPRGVELRMVPTDQDAVERAARGATLVWIETPSNPGLAVLDVGAVVAAAGGAPVVVDATLGGPLRVRALAAGAAMVMCSASKHLTGHSDLILGYVACADPQRARELRDWRALTGAIPGPFEAWLAHRSLATYALRLERMEANAGALAGMLGARDDVRDVRWPQIGGVLGFELRGGAPAARRFLAAAGLIAEATSFGGVHSSAERRARWGYGDAPEGWIRLSAGIEDAADLLADVSRALDAAA